MNNFQKNLQKYSVYLEEIKQKILLLTKIFVVVFALGFFGTTPAIRLMMKYIDLPGVTIATTSPFQLLDLAMSIGFFSACVVIIPVFVYQMYTFLKPALHVNEKRNFLLALPLAFFLFVVGFSYSISILYYGIKLIAKLNSELGVANLWNISTFISQIVMTSSLFGLFFIFPIVITYLVKMNAISFDFLKSKRKHAIVIIFILVSLLPPTDGLSLVLMAAPLMLIFEITVLINRKYSGRRLVI